MEKTIAKIKGVRLGWEDHGILTCWLDLDYGGAGQGAGGYALDDPVKDDDGHVERRGTAAGMEFVMRLMRACGVDEWSKMAGRTVYALHEDGKAGYGGGIVCGIAPLPTEPGEEFIFADLWAEHTDEVASL